MLCNSCKSPDTLLDRDSATRIMFLRCQQVRLLAAPWHSVARCTPKAAALWGNSVHAGRVQTRHAFESKCCTYQAADTVKSRHFRKVSIERFSEEPGSMASRKSYRADYIPMKCLLCCAAVWRVAHGCAYQGRLCGADLAAHQDRLGCGRGECVLHVFGEIVLGLAVLGC